MKWAVFKDGKQISKSHIDHLTAVIEAYEHGYIVTARDRNMLGSGYEIREVTP